MIVYFQIRKLWIDGFSFSSANNPNVTRNKNVENNVNDIAVNNNGNSNVENNIENNAVNDNGNSNANLNNGNENHFEAGRHNHVITVGVA